VFCGALQILVFIIALLFLGGVGGPFSWMEGAGGKKDCMVQDRTRLTSYVLCMHGVVFLFIFTCPAFCILLKGGTQRREVTSVDERGVELIKWDMGDILIMVGRLGRNTYSYQSDEIRDVARVGKEIC